MSEITALESRLTAALDRIRAGVDSLAVGPVIDASSGLEAQLAEERVANAQLEERVKALKERQDNKIAELEARLMSYRIVILPHSVARWFIYMFEGPS